jgi:hypothetical protein
MGEVFAGFVCGYILALLSTPVLAIFLIRMRAGSAFLARLLPEGTSATSLAVVLHVGLILAWTAAGMILGTLLLAMGESPDWLGSINGPFSLLVASLTLMLAAPLMAIVRPWRRLVLTYALLALVVFGWLMPYMAEWSRFDREAPVGEGPYPFQAHLYRPEGG